MSIVLGLAGKNLTIKAVQNQDTAAEREKIKSLRCQRIPIYRADTFLYFEIPKETLSQIYEMWKPEEVIVDLKAKELIDQYLFDLKPLSELFVEEVKCPDGFTSYPWQHQFSSIDFRKKRLALFMHTGSGKLLGMLLRAYNMGFTKLLVASTLSNQKDWREQTPLMFPNHSYSEYVGTKSARSKCNLDVDIVFTNHEQLKEITNLYDYDALIVDEAHLVANPEAKIFKVASQATRKKDLSFVFLSTASPIENEVGPIWGLANLLNPTFAGSLAEFKSKHEEVFAWKEITYQKYGREMTFKKPIKTRIRDVALLKQWWEKWAYRIDSSDDFKFEDVNEIIPLEITPRQMQLYDQIKDDIIAEIKGKTFYSENPLAKTARLFMAAESVNHFHEESMESNKLEWVIDYLKTTKKKVLVWSAWKKNTEVLGSLFPNGVILNGDKSKNYKELAKIAFQGAKTKEEEELFYTLLKKIPDFPVKHPGLAQFMFLTASSKGGAGMNLPQAEENVFMSVPLSARATLQSMGRAKRSNTKHEVITTKFLVTLGTIDPDMVKLVLRKINQMAKVLDGKNSSQDIKVHEIISLLDVKTGRKPSYTDRIPLE